MRGPFYYVYTIYALFRVDTRAKQRTIRHAITHLLNKALPQRCQIRNLKEIVQQYIGQYPKIRAFIDAVFAPLKLSAECVTELLQHQHMLFMFLKRFVVARVDEIPPLVVHLQSRCNWYSFSESVKLICHRVKHTIQQNLARGVHLMDNVQSVITYMSRMQIRNIMSPCYMHLLQSLFIWSDVARSNGFMANSNRIVLEPIHLLSTRVLENYGISTRGAYYIRECMQTYLKDANKNNLFQQLDRLSPVDGRCIRAVLLTIQSFRTVSAIPTPACSTIQMYICGVCREIKNTLTTFTSLRDIMYDARNDSLYCVNKRNPRCREQELHNITMDHTYIVIGSTVYGICPLCGILFSNIISCYTHTTRICETCQS